MRPVRKDLLSVASAVSLLIGLGGSLLLDDPRLRYPSHVVLWAVAVGGALSAWRLAPRKPVLQGLIVVGLALRAAAWLSAPAFSEDVFRYIYEGRVALWGGPLFVFDHPPADGPALGVPQDLMGAAWLRINHPELATIYPPFALALFSASAAVGGVVGAELLTLKAFLVVADLATWRLLHRRDPHSALLWGLSPLVIWEIAREGHADVLSSLGIVAGAIAFHQGWSLRGYAGWLGAALAKLNGLILMPLALRATRRGAWVLVPGVVLLALPYALTAGSEPSGLSAYATRWRAGDGAFSIVLVVAEQLLGGDWARLEGFGASLTVTRHQVARAIVAGLFGAFYLALLWRKSAVSELGKRAGTLLVVLLLLSPTLHPWYVLWVLPLAAMGPFPGRWTALWLASSAVLLHHPGWIELLEGQWRDLAAPRTVVHLPAWLLLAVEHRLPSRSDLSS